jgi:uncharacterized protein (UPF0147 family)
MDFMFKFRQDEDAQAFLVEIGIYENITKITKDYEPTVEQIEKFIKSRSGYSGGSKDKDKSNAQKKNWRKNKGKIKRGIKAFHKSVEGKKFHRNMGRFLATRITRDKLSDRNESFSILENIEYIKALNSAKQQLFIELDYFHALTEQAQLETLVMDYAIPMFRTIEQKMVFNEELDEDEFDFLIEMTNKNQLLSELSDRINVPVEKLTEVWKSSIVKLNTKDYTLEQFNEDFAKEVRTLK